jgi:hypothetical protein
MAAVAPQVPQVAPAPALHAEMEALFVRLGFTAAAAHALVVDQPHNVGGCTPPTRQHGLARNYGLSVHHPLLIFILHQLFIHNSKHNTYRSNNLHIVQTI